MVRVKIVSKDCKQVTKVVIIDNDNRVLMLKRSDYMDKYAGEWDLPGGHIKVGESLEIGLKREIKEETDLTIENVTFIEKMDNLYFYFCAYNQKPIKLSDEHTGFRFFSKQNLDPSKKFEKIALKALEIKK